MGRTQIHSSGTFSCCLPVRYWLSKPMRRMSESIPPTGNPNSSWAPVINTWPGIVSRASTYQLTGTQFNGLSQGASYGDDTQAATNYPIVAIVNNTTGHVIYERTFGFNTMSVA